MVSRKKILAILMAIFVFLAVVNCDNGSGSDSPLESVTNDLMKLKDDNGNVLGTVTLASNFVITVVNDQGYMYSVYWDGNYCDSFLYYSEPDCTGEPVYNFTSPPYGRSVFYNNYENKYYVPKYLNEELVVHTDYQARSLFLNGATINYSTAVNLSSVFELSEVTPSEVGLFDTIVLPLQLFK